MVWGLDFTVQKEKRLCLRGRCRPLLWVRESNFGVVNTNCISYVYRKVCQTVLCCPVPGLGSGRGDPPPEKKEKREQENICLGHYFSGFRLLCGSSSLVTTLLLFIMVDDEKFRVAFSLSVFSLSSFRLWFSGRAADNFYCFVSCTLNAPLVASKISAARRHRSAPYATHSV